MFLITKFPDQKWRKEEGGGRRSAKPGEGKFEIEGGVEKRVKEGKFVRKGKEFSLFVWKNRGTKKKREERAVEMEKEGVEESKEEEEGELRKREGENTMGKWGEGWALGE